MSVADDQELRKRVNAARGYAGYSLPELAAELGISDSTIKRILKDPPHGKKREDFIGRVARRTKLPVEFFTVDFGRLPELATAAQPSSPLQDQLDALRADLELLAGEVRQQSAASDQPSQDPAQPATRS